MASFGKPSWGLAPVIAVALIFVFAGGLAARADRTAMTADEAIQRSIAQPTAPIEPSWVIMDVCAAGADGPRGFLNSRRDYRDRGSLNVELPVSVRRDLAERLGGDPIDVLRGQRIAVYGQARQVRINLLREGRRTGRYYFQTQLRLNAADLLEIIERDGQAQTAACDLLLS